MSLSLIYLGCTLVLAIVQLLLTAALKRRQDGMQWAAGNRDGDAPVYTGVAGRMVRALANLYESLPIFIGAVLLAHISGHDSPVVAWGAAIFFWCRVVYIPVYASGVGLLRSAIWATSLAGLVTVLVGLVYP